jgi:hypothetical protein
MAKIENDFLEPYEAWKAKPDKATASSLLTAVNPVIDSALKTYGGSSQQSPTLRSRARRIALDSFGTYDPARGTLRTHLMSQMQSLRRAAAQQQQIISMPEQVQLDAYRTDQAGRELEDRLGRQPSDEEIANYTGLSKKRLEHIRKAKRPVSEGTLMQARGENSPFMPQVNPNVPQADAWAEFVYSDLPPTDQFIMERAMGLHGHQPMPSQEIARRLRISPGAISQRMVRIQNKLDMQDQQEML